MICFLYRITSYVFSIIYKKIVKLVYYGLIKEKAFPKFSAKCILAPKHVEYVTSHQNNKGPLGLLTLKWKALQCVQNIIDI